MSAAGRALSRALDKPEDWEFPSDYRIHHKPSNQDFWIGNGAFFFDIHDGGASCLGYLERHWLYRKTMRSSAGAVVAKFEAAEAIALK